MNKKIKKIIKLVKRTFPENSIKILDDGDSIAINFQKDNKIMYVAGYDEAYFYDLELWVDDPDILYIPQGSDNVKKQRDIIKVMSEFFQIEPIN